MIWGFVLGEGRRGNIERKFCKNVNCVWIYFGILFDRDGGERREAGRLSRHGIACEKTKVTVAMLGDRVRVSFS